MTFPEALYSHLSSDATIITLIQLAERVYWDYAPDFLRDEYTAAPYPYIVFSLERGEPDYAINNDGVLRETWEVSACAGDGDTRHTLAEAIIATLNHYRGVMGGVSGVRVDSCALRDYSDDRSGELGLFVRRLTFDIQRPL